MEVILRRKPRKRQKQLGLFTNKDSRKSLNLGTSRRRASKPVKDDRWWISFIPPTEAEWQQYLARGGAK